MFNMLLFDGTILFFIEIELFLSSPVVSNLSNSLASPNHQHVQLDFLPHLICFSTNAYYLCPIKTKLVLDMIHPSTTNLDIHMSRLLEYATFNFDCLFYVTFSFRLSFLDEGSMMVRRCTLTRIGKATNTFL